MRMEEVTKAEKPGYIHSSWVDIENALSRITKNHYVFNGWYHVFCSDLSEEEKQKIQAECDAAEEVWIKKIVKDVDKAIIEDMRKTHPEYFNS